MKKLIGLLTMFVFVFSSFGEEEPIPLVLVPGKHLAGAGYQTRFFPFVFRNQKYVRVQIETTHLFVDLLKQKREGVVPCLVVMKAGEVWGFNREKPFSFQMVENLKMNLVDGTKYFEVIIPYEKWDKDILGNVLVFDFRLLKHVTYIDWNITV